MEIYQRIREVRQSKGVSQKHLALCLGISQSAYCQKEKGSRRFSVDELLLIGIELGVNPGIFFEDQLLKMRQKETA